MKKNLLFLLILLLATGLTAGCSLFGDDDEAAPAGSTAKTVNLAGTVPATFAAAAPGRNLAINASSLTAVAVNAETGADIASIAVTAGRSFTIPMSISSAVKTMIHIRRGSNTVLSKFVGAVQVPTATATVGGITIDAESTAKAIAVAAVIAKGTAAQTVAEKAVLNAPVNPDTLTSLAVSDPANAQIESLAAANPALATLGTNMQNQVTAILAAIVTVADPTTVLTTSVTTPTALATVAKAVLTEASTTPAVATAITTAGVNNLTVGAVTVNVGTAPTTITTEVINAVATTITTATAAATVPYISSIYLDSTATKKVYDATAGATTAAATYPTSPITVAFTNGPVDLTNVKFKIRVTETVGSTVTTKTVVHGYTRATGELDWMTAFGAAPTWNTTNQTAITITPGGGSVKPGWNGTAYVAATIKIELLQFEGATLQGNSAVLLAAPVAVSGTYTIPAYTVQ